MGVWERGKKRVGEIDDWWRASEREARARDLFSFATRGQWGSFRWCFLANAPAPQNVNQHTRTVASHIALCVAGEECRLEGRARCRERAEKTESCVAVVKSRFFFSPLASEKTKRFRCISSFHFLSLSSLSLTCELISGSGTAPARLDARARATSASAALAAPPSLRGPPHTPPLLDIFFKSLSLSGDRSPSSSSSFSSPLQEGSALSPSKRSVRPSVPTGAEDSKKKEKTPGIQEKREKNVKKQSLAEAKRK